MNYRNRHLHMNNTILHIQIECLMNLDRYNFTLEFITNLLMDTMEAEVMVFSTSISKGISFQGH